MKKVLYLALVGSLMCAVSASAQTVVTYTLVLDPSGLDYHIEAAISGDACEGLALWGADVVWTTGTVGGQMANPNLPSFENDAVEHLGLNNPAGYGGTSNLVDKLLQVGGGQNTIDNDASYAPYPVGDVVLDVANPGPVTVATGVCVDGDVIELGNCFANVLDDTGPDVFAVSAATVTCAGSITCGGCASLTAAYSMGTHGGGEGDLGLLIGASGFVEPRTQGASGDLWVELQFDAAVVPGDFDVVMNPDPGVAYQLVAGDVGTELKLTYGGGQVPDDMYNVTITCAGAKQGGGFCLSYLEADVNGSGIVEGLDDAAVAASWGQSAGSSAATKRADINRSGIVEGLDSAAIAAHWGQSAPLCP